MAFPNMEAIQHFHYQFFDVSEMPRKPSLSNSVQYGNALECREDVGFSNLAIKELLHVLANPSLAEPLTPKMLGAWLEKVQAVR